jgi:hypothetical protein
MELGNDASRNTAFKSLSAEDDRARAVVDYESECGDQVVHENRSDAQFSDIDRHFVFERAQFQEWGHTLRQSHQVRPDYAVE